MLDFSGVWRFRELLPFWRQAGNQASDIVTIGEGRTNLQRADRLAGDLGFDTAGGGRLYLQYEGFNPSGSFKDNGMAAAFTRFCRAGDEQRLAAALGSFPESALAA